MHQDLVPIIPAPAVPFRMPPDRPAPAAIAQLVIVLFKWHRLVLGLALAFTVAAIVVAVLKPSSHPATAKVLFKPDRAALQISGLSAPSSRLPYSPQVLQSEVELFRSRSVLVPVATALLGADKASPQQIEAKAVSLRQGLLVTVVPDTSVIQVTYSGRSAPEAERTLGLIVKQYTEQHAAAYRDSTGVVAFYEKEASRAGGELTAAEQELTEWQAEHKTVAIDAEIASHLEKLATIEKSLNQTQADIQGTDARLASLERLAKSQPERSVMSRERVPNPLVAKLTSDLADAEIALNTLQRNPVIDKLKTDVASAEVALKEATNTPLIAKLKADLVTADVALHDLQRRYTDLDRVVVEKKAQVAVLRQELATAEREAEGVARERLKQLRVELVAAERQLDVEARERISRLRRELAEVRAQGDLAGRETTGPNPLREGVERDLIAARAQATALVSQREALRQQSRDVASVLGELRDKKLGVDRRLRSIALARESYLTHAKRLEDAKISAALDRHSLSDVAVIEPPYATGESDVRRRIMLVVLAGVVGVGLGVAAALAIEFFNNAVRTAEDVEFYVGLPVLATIPTLPGSATSLVTPRPAHAAAGRPDRAAIEPDSES
jgi:uncharacterized protein involved in exopolysaccharide biosynthesis